MVLAMALALALALVFVSNVAGPKPATAKQFLRYLA